MQSDEEREQVFWSYIEVAGPNDCWEWMRGLTRGGYGLFQVRKGKPRRAHRHAWSLVNGPIPNGMFVLHSCDNPLCCNPAHLHLGDHAQNMREMVERGRSLSGDRNVARAYPERVARGQAHYMRRNPNSVRRGSQLPQAKLDENAVREIRSSREPLRVVAARYGITEITASRARRGVSWAHIPMGEAPA